MVERVLAKRAELARMMAYHDGPTIGPSAEAKPSSVCSMSPRRTRSRLIAALGGVLSDARSTLRSPLFAAFGSTAKTDNDAETQFA